MLIGEYRNKLVAGNRVAFPKRFREEIGQKVVVAQGYEGCLVAVSPTQWEELVADAASGPFVSGSVRDTTRFLLGSAVETELDYQGRFVVPQSLREYASLGDEVCFLGLGRWVEIWDKKRWVERKKYIDEHSGEIGEKLAKLEM